MKHFCLTVVFVTLMGSTSFGQVPALERGSAAAAQAVEDYRGRLAAADEAWRSAKKLTVLENLPDAPRDQTGCLSVPDLKDDSVGYLEYWHFDVLQVVGPMDLLISMRNPNVSPLWVTGHPTDGIVDGDSVRLVGLVEVDGTKSYTSVAGATKTVRVVRLVSKKRLAEIEAERAAKAKAAEEMAWTERWKNDSHSWTDKTGKYSIVAVYDDYLGEGKVRFLKEDKSEVIVSLSQLSEPDRRKAVALRRAAERND